MGLACKNAILIVEFARELEMQGRGNRGAALEACRLRSASDRDDLSSFHRGSVPLLLGMARAAEVRAATGVTVFFRHARVTLVRPVPHSGVLRHLA